MTAKRIIPILNVREIDEAVAFYRDRLGFEQLSLFRRGPDQPGYASLMMDEGRLHLSSFPGDGTPGCSFYVDVDDIEALRTDLLGRGWSEGDLQIMGQDWGNREIYITDADGNTIRFARSDR